MNRYRIPASRVRVEEVILRSRFITSAAPAATSEEARAFIAEIRTEFADASHNCYAFVAGPPGSTGQIGMSDDGEPSGTAGRPMMAVLLGSGVGDVAVVVTRYFGGIKLGTGGLVRAYSDAVRQVLAILPRAERIQVHVVMLAAPYNWFERLRLLIAAHHGELLEQDFAADITLTARFPSQHLPAFQNALSQASHGSLAPEIIATEMAIVPFQDR
jgi:uncharacterized YigZ family protein